MKGRGCIFWGDSFTRVFVTRGRLCLAFRRVSVNDRFLTGFPCIHLHLAICTNIIKIVVAPIRKSIHKHTPQKQETSRFISKQSHKPPRQGNNIFLLIRSPHSYVAKGLSRPLREVLLGRDEGCCYKRHDVAGRAVPQPATAESEGSLRRRESGSPWSLRAASYIGGSEASNDMASREEFPSKT